MFHICLEQIALLEVSTQTKVNWSYCQMKLPFFTFLVNLFFRLCHSHYRNAILNVSDGEKVKVVDLYFF